MTALRGKFLETVEEPAVYLFLQTTDIILKEMTSDPSPKGNSHYQIKNDFHFNKSAEAILSQVSSRLCMCLS